MTSVRGAPGAAVETAPLPRRVLEAELVGIVGAGHEARFIVDEVLARRAPPGPSLGRHRLVDPDAAGEARRLAGRRAAGEPLQYVLGRWAFRGLELAVDPRVLIPRPETEQVVEVALAEVRRWREDRTAGGDPRGDRPVVVDLGTGSGAIALSVAVELGSAVREVWATDTSADALAVAAANLEAVRRRSEEPLPDVVLALGSWFDPLPERLRGEVALVVSNPPYVSGREWEDLDPVVRAEPRAALVAVASKDGTPGLGDVESVLIQARSWLAAGGAAVVELAPHQAQAAAELARALGYGQVHVAPDLAGRPRAVVARLTR